MIHKIFEWREDEEFGGEGWILKGYPSFNVANGNGIAHDTIEHFKGGDGGLSDEMMAFVSGAMFLVKAYAQIQNVSTPQVVLHPVFDVGELHTTLQVVLTRGNEIPSKLPQSVDPTR